MATPATQFCSVLDISTSKMSKLVHTVYTESDPKKLLHDGFQLKDGHLVTKQKHVPVEEYFKAVLSKLQNASTAVFLQLTTNNSTMCGDC